LSTTFSNDIIVDMEKITDAIVMTTPVVKVGGDAVKIEDESNGS